MTNEEINALFKRFLSTDEWKLFDTLHFSPSHFIDERQKNITGILRLKLDMLMHHGARKSRDLQEIATNICRYVLFPTENGYMLIKLNRKNVL
jgi:hypothetical protein